METLFHNNLEIIKFSDKRQLDIWYKKNHTRELGFWLRIYKKASGISTVSYPESVDSALCWGWIDGLLNKYDTTSYLIRFTPRRPKSVWSQVNVAKVAKLIESGEMQPEGLQVVEAAQKDGRWEAAYAGQKTITVPQIFLDLLNTNSEAKKRYESMTKGEKYSIAFKIATAVGQTKKLNVIQKLFDSLKD